MTNSNRPLVVDGIDVAIRNRTTGIVIANQIALESRHGATRRFSCVLRATILACEGGYRGTHSEN